MATLLNGNEVCEQIVQQMVNGLDPDLRMTLTCWPWMRQAVIDRLWKELGLRALSSASISRVTPYRADLSSFGEPTMEKLTALFGEVDPRFAEARVQNGAMYGKRFEHMLPASGVRDLVGFSPQAPLHFDDVIDWGCGTNLRVCLFGEGCSVYKSALETGVKLVLPLALLGTTFFIGSERYVAVMEGNAISLTPRDRLFGSQMRYLLIGR